MNFNFSQLLDLKGDSAPFSEIRQRIASDASVKGANLVILITAILIASVGLNMNSTAVIIGAMLISPLMGGLVATGYGMATYDMQFIKDSMVKLGFQVSFALITSAIYFFSFAHQRCIFRTLSAHIPDHLGRYHRTSRRYRWRHW